MVKTLSEITDYLRSKGFEVDQRGPDELEIHSVATLEQGQTGQISFLANQKYAKQLEQTSVSALIISTNSQAPDRIAQLRLDDPYYALRFVIELIYGSQKHPFTGVAHRAVIDPTATVGQDASIAHDVTICQEVQIGSEVVIYPGCFIGPRCTLGDQVVLYPNVAIYDDCVLGDRITIHASTVIGNDGFGYATHDGVHHKIRQIGNVVIEDDVVLGANCSIDRGGLDSTVIGRGSKFSNLIAVGHGTKIGPHCLLVAQVGIAGSTKVGHHVTIAGQAGVVGHIEIGDNVTIAARAGVTRSISQNQVIWGQPAIPINEAKRQTLLTSKLPEMRKEHKRLQKQMVLLQEQIDRLTHQSDRPGKQPGQSG